MEVLLLALSLLASVETAASEKAAELSEEIEVRRVQFEVTAWPRDGELALCREIDLDQVEVFVDGAWKTRLQDPGIVIDRIGVRPGETIAIEGDAVAPPQPVPQRLVLYFDEVHFFDAERIEEDSARDRAYEQARAWLEEGFDPSSGDLVMLASYMGNDSVNIETGWLSDRDTAIAALDTLDERGKDRSKVSATENVMERWSDALEDLALAMGGLDEREDWTKKILLFATDLPVDAEWAEELARASEALSAARATVHTVDTRKPLSSLAYGLGSLAWNAGGHAWTNGVEVSDAVTTMRQLPGAGCVFLVTATVGKIEGVIRVDFKDERFRSESLMALGRPASELAEDQREARRLRPSWGDDVAVETLIIPGERVRGGRLSRLYVRTRSTHPEHVLRVGFRGADVEDIEERFGEARDFVFEVVVRPRKQTTYRVSVETPGGEHGASDTQVFRASSAPSWHLVDASGAPLFSTQVDAHEELKLRGYGCPRGDERSLVLTREDGESVAFTVASSVEDGCGWYEGALAEGLSVGLWTLDPPRRYQGGALTLTVTPSGAKDAPKSEQGNERERQREERAPGP